MRNARRPMIIGSCSNLISLGFACSLLSVSALAQCNVSFSYRTGDQNTAPPSGSCSFTNTTNAILALSESRSSWLWARPTVASVQPRQAFTMVISVINPQSISSSGSISLAVRTQSGVQLGTINATISVTSGPAPPIPTPNPPQPPQPQPRSINLSHSALTFAHEFGVSDYPPEQRFTVSSQPTGIPFTARSETAWLQVRQERSTTPSDVLVIAGTTSRIPGRHPGRIVVESSGATNTPQVVQVELIESDTIQFQYRPGFDPPGPRCINLEEQPGQAFSSSVTEPWLVVTPSGGLQPQRFCVGVNPDGLTAGLHRGSVSVLGIFTIGVILTVHEAPSLSVTPESLSFTLVGERPAAPQALRIDSTPPGLQFRVEIARGGEWLKVDGSERKTPSTLDVTVDASSLTPGAYSGQLRVVASGAAGSPRGVSVNVTVPEPRLTARPPIVLFFHEVGSAPPSPMPLALDVQAPGASESALRFDVEVDHGDEQPWISVVKPTDLAPAVILVNVDPEKVSLGRHIRNIKIHSPKASNSPLIIPVYLDKVLPKISTNPERLSFNRVRGDRAPDGASLAVKSSNDTQLSFVATASSDSPSPWLSVNPQSGSTPTTINVRAEATSLPTGVYRGAVRIDAQNAKDNGSSVPAELVVRDRPTLLARPDSLSFAYERGRELPPSRTVTIAAGNSDFSATPSIGWISVTPTNSRTPQSIEVTVQPGGLALGAHDGAVDITAADTNGSPMRVPIRLIVSDSGIGRLEPNSLSFEAQEGSTQVQIRNILFHSTGSQIYFSAEASGGDWLSVHPLSGSTGSVSVQTGQLVQNVPRTLTVQVNSTSLRPGSYDGMIRVTPEGSGDPLLAAVKLRVTSRVLNVPQVVDGQGWSTEIVVANTGPKAAPTTVRFWNSNGTPLSIPIQGDETVTEHTVTVTVPLRGVVVLKTGGNRETLLQGWAEVTSDGSVEATAILKRSEGGVTKAQAAFRVVPAVSGRLLFPFESGPAIATCVALLNASGDRPTNVNMSFRDEDAKVVASEDVSLGPRRQSTFCLSEKTRSLADRKGIAEFTGSGQISLLILRFSPDGSFSSLVPIGDAIASSQQHQPYLPLVRNGDAWKTTIALYNAGGEASPFSLTFRDDSGAPFAFRIAGLGLATELADTLAPGAIRFIESEAQSDKLFQGWATVISRGAVQGIGILRRQVGDGPYFERLVPFSTQSGTNHLVPFDEAGGSAISVVLFNPSTRNTTVSIQLRDQEGRVFGSRSMAIPGLALRTFVLAELFSDVKGRVGVMEFNALEPFLSQSWGPVAGR